MTKKQKKQFLSYIFIFIITLVVLISEKLGKSSISTVIDENQSYNYVHFIDAGQGDCTLIEADGKFALIDASTDIESNRIISYLENEGVEELEFVIFTHPHEDHIGGGDEILENFIVKNVYMNDKTENTSCYTSLIDAIAQSKKSNGTKVTKARTGDILNLGNNSFYILSDGSDYYDNANNSSICLKMELGKSTFLFTGDAEKVVEYDLLDNYAGLDAEVYKCAHHGSSTSNSRDFLDTVNPDISIISCGKNNDYGHPHKEVISYLSENDIITKRTDIDGSVIIAYNANEIVIM